MIDRTLLGLTALTAINIFMFSAVSTEILKSYLNADLDASEGEGEGEGEGETAEVYESEESAHLPVRVTSPEFNKILCDY